MTRNLLGVALMMISGVVMAERVVELDHLPDHMVKPCHREVPLSRLTSAVVPVLPGRGVNLMFPKVLELSKDNVSVSLSSDDLLQAKPLMEDAAIIPIGFKKVDYQRDVGEVRDMTIALEHFTVTLGLTVDLDPTRHCTNIEFTLSEAQRKRVEQEHKERYQAALDAKFAQRMEQLDREVEEKALLMVAGLATDTPEQWRIKEASALELANGDEVELYVRDIQQFGGFYVLSFEVENGSRTQPVYISQSEVKAGTVVIQGAMRLAKKLDPGEI